MISNVISVVAYTTSFLPFVKRTYFVSSPEANMFNVSQFIPPWWIPENPLIRQQIIRTFFISDWILHYIFITLLGHILYILLCKKIGKKTVEELKWATFAGIFIGYGSPQLYLSF